MNAKTKSLVSKIVNIVCMVILALVLLLTISIIVSSGKGYTAVFGKVYFKVASNSMDGEFGQNGDYSSTWTFEKNGFKVGEVIVVDVLNDSEKNSLVVGDIITFRMSSGELNTHRIVQINGEGEKRTYTTQGDNTIARDGIISNEDIIGKYTGQKNGSFAWFFNSINTKTGYILIIVVPTAIVLIYCVYLVIKTIVERNNEKLSIERNQYKEELEKEKEKMRMELLNELIEKNKALNSSSAQVQADSSTAKTDDEVEPKV